MATHRSFTRGHPLRNKVPDLRLLEGVVSERILRAMRDATLRLDDLQIPYALIGGLAVGAHGAPRATKDVDFLVGEEAFEHHGPIVSFRAGLPIESGGVAVDPVSIGAEETFLVEAIQAATQSFGVPVIGIGPLIYMKLSAGRRQDEADVQRLMEAGSHERAAREYLEQHAPQLLPDLERCLEPLNSRR